MNTKIKLSAMRFYAAHGCYDTEQKVGTRFEVNLTVDYDSTKAAASDDIQDAVSYLSLYRCVKDQMQIPSHILENVAARTLDSLGAQFEQITHATISIAKLSPPLGGDIERVSVEQERHFV